MADKTPILLKDNKVKNNKTKIEIITQRKTKYKLIKRKVRKNTPKIKPKILK